MSTQNKEKWEEEFEKTFTSSQLIPPKDATEEYINVVYSHQKDELKSFIRQTLASQKREIVEKAEKYVAQENAWDEHPKASQFQKGALSARNKMMDFIKSLTEQNG